MLESKDDERDGGVRLLPPTLVDTQVFAVEFLVLLQSWFSLLDLETDDLDIGNSSETSAGFFDVEIFGPLGRTLAVFFRRNR